MPATNHTPNGKLSQFISTDKPAWLGDYNGDMLLIDALIESGRKVVGFFASEYGAKGDGVTDDITALNNCAAAALASGYSTFVVLDKPGGIYLISGMFNLPNKVGLRGLASMDYHGNGSTIKLNSATACVVFGLNNLDTGGGGTLFSPGAFDFDVDGNSTGPLVGALRWDAVNDTNVERVSVKNAAGHGIAIRCGQNNSYRDVMSVSNGHGASGDDWHLSGGTGGNLFERCYGGGSPNYFLSFTKDTGIIDVYSQGPSHNKFDHCIFETSAVVPMKAVAHFDAGGPNVFDDCLFVATNPSDFAVIHVTGGFQASYNNCHFVGSTCDAFLLETATSVTRVTGHSLFQLNGTGYGNVYKVNASVFIDHEQMSSIYIITGHIIKYGTGGSVKGSTIDHIAGEKFIVSADETTLTNIVNYQIVKEGDTQARFFQTADGSMAWGPGGTTFPDNVLGRDATGKFMALNSGLSVKGSFLNTTGSAQSIGGTSATYTIDTSLTSYAELTATAGAFTPTVQFTNPINGAYITVLVANATTATVPVEGMLFTSSTGSVATSKKNKIPPIGPGESFTITFRYDAGSTTWYEVSRSAAKNNYVPATIIGGTSGTYNLDCNYGNLFEIVATAGATTPVFHLINMADGDEVTLLMVAAGSAITGATITSATGTVNLGLGNAIPSVPATAGACFSITLRYLASSPGWYEISRAG